MSRYRGPTRLSADHNTDGFDCGDETLDNWLKRISPRNRREGSSRTWVRVARAEHRRQFAGARLTVSAAPGVMIVSWPAGVRRTQGQWTPGYGFGFSAAQWCR